MELWMKIYSKSITGEEYKDNVSKLDKMRTVNHNSVIANVNLLNRLAEKNGLQPVYDGIVSEERPYRREIANDVLDYVFPAPIGCKKTLSDIMHGDAERQYAFTIRIGGRRSGINNKYNWDCYMVDGAPRYITVEECLELQGFPRDFKLIGNKDKQFKQVGNAVPTIIVEAIGTLAFGKI
jgi:site-specific DNA-cytosine methylase